MELLTYELVYAAAVEVTCDIQSHIQCYLFDIYMAIRFTVWMLNAGVSLVQGTYTGLQKWLFGECLTCISDSGCHSA